MRRAYRRSAVDKNAEQRERDRATIHELMKSVDVFVWMVYVPLYSVISDEDIKHGFGGVYREGGRARGDQPKLVGKTLIEIGEYMLDGIPVSLANRGDLDKMYEVLADCEEFFGSVNLVSNFGIEEGVAEIIEFLLDSIYNAQSRHIQSGLLKDLKLVRDRYVDRLNYSNASQVDPKKKGRKQIIVVKG